MLTVSTTEKNIMKNIWQWLTKYAGNLFVAVLFVIFLMTGLLFQKDQATFKKQEQTKEYVLKDGTQVASSNIKEVTASEIKQVIKTSNKNTKAVAKKFSSVKGITTTVNEIKIDTIQVKPKDSVQFNFEYGGEMLNKEYSFNYRVNQHGFTITDFKMIDTTVTVEGKKRTWLFGKSKDSLDNFHTNKNIKTQQLESVKTKPKKHWLLSDVAKGIYAGLFIGGVYMGVTQ